MKKIPIKYKTMNEGFSFVLKDQNGVILDDTILPHCTIFSHHIAHLTFAACSGLMRSTGTRFGILEVTGKNKSTLQAIEFDAELYRKWRDSLR